MSALYLIPVTLGDSEHRPGPSRIQPGGYPFHPSFHCRKCTYGTPFPEKDRAFDRDLTILSFMN